MTIQAQADAIITGGLMVVCDGWTEPRHPRVVLKAGDPEQISHGMCKACHEQIRPAWAAPVSAVPASKTARWERMREAHWEMYDLLRDVLRARYETRRYLSRCLDNIKALIARIDGDTK